MIVGPLVNIKSRRVVFCDLKQVGSLIRFVRPNISFISDKWFFEESVQGLNSSIFKSPARMILLFLDMLNL